jgi:alcohol dehydrogenase, propanol-preferring
MPETMRAYRLLEWQQQPRLVETGVPRSGPGQILVKVAGNGLCHSDLSMVLMPGEIGEAIGWRVPFTLGHEISGWVADVGEGVTEVRVGDAVALTSPSSCGRCDFCVRGQDSACASGDAGRGYGRDGGLAQYVVADSMREVLPLGDLDPVAAAPLTDAGATAYHAVSRVLSRLVPGSTAVVIGAGGLGSFAVQFLRTLSPARVIAVDQNPARLEYATELGAHETLSGVEADTTRRLRERTGGQGAHVVLDFVGIDDTIRAGVPAVRRTGAFALVGAGGGTFASPWFGGLPREAEVFTLQGSRISHARDVMALARAGRIRSDVERFSFDQIDDAYHALHEGRLRGRAVVVP